MCVLHTRVLFVAQLEGFGVSSPDMDAAAKSADIGFSSAFARTSEFMSHPVFNTHHSEASIGDGMSLVVHPEHRDRYRSPTIIFQRVW